jgi:hypothetical protein
VAAPSGSECHENRRDLGAGYAQLRKMKMTGLILKVGQLREEFEYTSEGTNERIKANRLPVVHYAAIITDIKRENIEVGN